MEANPGSRHVKFEEVLGNSFEYKLLRELGTTAYRAIGRNKVPIFPRCKAVHRYFGLKERNRGDVAGQRGLRLPEAARLARIPVSNLARWFRPGGPPAFEPGPHFRHSHNRQEPRS